MSNKITIAILLLLATSAIAVYDITLFGDVVIIFLDQL